MWVDVSDSSERTHWMPKALAAHNRSCNSRTASLAGSVSTWLPFSLGRKSPATGARLTHKSKIEPVAEYCRGTHLRFLLTRTTEACSGRKLGHLDHAGPSCGARAAGHSDFAGTDQQCQKSAATEQPLAGLVDESPRGHSPLQAQVRLDCLRKTSPREENTTITVSRITEAHSATTIARFSNSAQVRSCCRQPLHSRIEVIADSSAPVRREGAKREGALLADDEKQSDLRRDHRAQIRRRFVASRGRKTDVAKTRSLAL